MSYCTGTKNSSSLQHLRAGGSHLQESVFLLSPGWVQWQVGRLDLKKVPRLGMGWCSPRIWGRGHDRGGAFSSLEGAL